MLLIGRLLQLGQSKCGCGQRSKWNERRDAAWVQIVGSGSAPPPLHEEGNSFLPCWPLLEQVTAHKHRDRLSDLVPQCRDVDFEW